MNGLNTTLENLPDLRSLGDVEIYCHPDNLQAVKEALLSKDLFSAPLDDRPWMSPIRTSRSIPKTQSTGRVIAPDGSTQERQWFKWKQDRFTTLEASDLPWLIGLGIVKEEQTVSVYLVQRAGFLTNFSYAPKLKEPRSVIKCFSS